MKRRPTVYERVAPELGVHVGALQAEIAALREQNEKLTSELRKARGALADADGDLSAGNAL